MAVSVVLFIIKEQPIMEHQLQPNHQVRQFQHQEPITSMLLQVQDVGERKEVRLLQ
jgi:hypothetical protein